MDFPQGSRIHRVEDVCLPKFNYAVEYSWRHSFLDAKRKRAAMGI
jgi:hypothetical protein